MSKTIISAPHGGDKTRCAGICKTADSETCMCQGSIPGSSLSMPLAHKSWVDKEKICLDFFIFSKREKKRSSLSDC